MNIKETYNIWAECYDSGKNKTRDLEAIALKNTLSSINFKNCLEIGCGTGKNTEWLTTKANRILAVDFSDKMLNKAISKLNSSNVEFIKADINLNWNFKNTMLFDLAIFSLVLEHIENLDHIFEQLNKYVKMNSYVYIGELHPFKQYLGSKARFEINQEVYEVKCFTHNISEYLNAANSNGFILVNIDEYFDNDDKTKIPRLLTLLFKKV